MMNLKAVMVVDVGNGGGGAVNGIDFRSRVLVTSLSEMW